MLYSPDGMDPKLAQAVTLFLCGDVMTGRGIDQVLPFPGNPVLYESWVHDARDYVDLAEKANGPIHRPVAFRYIWGDALKQLASARVDLRIINLETSITANDEPWPRKPIHYRMHPQNIGCLKAAGVTACALANNHVLDWGYAGLTETLQALDHAGIAGAGAGRNREEAAAPVVLQAPGRTRLLLFSFGSVSSGVPPEWAATGQCPGVNVLEELSEATASRVADQMRQFRKPGDLMIASIHWGSNWGYEVPREQITFAHRLIEEGVAIVHGHSSHHVRPVEVYQDRPILYGCGDFLTDYEGITGYEAFRGDLALMYLITLDLNTRRLTAGRLIPFQMHRFRLRRASLSDSEWLCALLNRLGKTFNSRFDLAEDASINLNWHGPLLALRRPAGAHGAGLEFT